MINNSDPNFAYAAKLILIGFAELHKLKLTIDSQDRTYVTFRHNTNGVIHVGLGKDNLGIFIHWSWCEDQFDIGKRTSSGGKLYLLEADFVGVINKLHSLSLELGNKNIDDFTSVENFFDWSSMPRRVLEEHMESIPYFQSVGSGLAH